jgi:hypothetical protein
MYLSLLHLMMLTDQVSKSVFMSKTLIKVTYYVHGLLEWSGTDHNTYHKSQKEYNKQLVRMSTDQRRCLGIQTTSQMSHIWNKLSKIDNVQHRVDTHSISTNSTNMLINNMANRIKVCN